MEREDISSSTSHLNYCRPWQPQPRERRTLKPRARPSTCCSTPLGWPPRLLRPRIRDGQQRCRRHLPAAMGATPSAPLGRRCAKACPGGLGRQLIGRERGQHRQPRPGSPGHRNGGTTPWAMCANALGEIWADTSDALMAGLKQHPRPVQGRWPMPTLGHLQQQHPRSGPQVTGTSGPKTQVAI